MTADTLAAAVEQDGRRLVFVVTDGRGTFQARCSRTACGVRGPWRKSEPRAIEDAKAHQCEDGT